MALTSGHFHDLVPLQNLFEHRTAVRLVHDNPDSIRIPGCSFDRAVIGRRLSISLQSHSHREKVIGSRSG